MYFFTFLFWDFRICFSVFLSDYSGYKFLCGGSRNSQVVIKLIWCQAAAGVVLLVPCILSSATVPAVDNWCFFPEKFSAGLVLCHCVCTESGESECLGRRRGRGDVSCSWFVMRPPALRHLCSAALKT